MEEGSAQLIQSKKLTSHFVLFFFFGCATDNFKISMAYYNNHLLF